MLDDFAITPARVSFSVGWGNQSLMTRPSRVSSGGTTNLVRGVTLPASSSPATVSTFSTDPGS